MLVNSFKVLTYEERDSESLSYPILENRKRLGLNSLVLQEISPIVHLMADVFLLYNHRPPTRHEARQCHAHVMNHKIVDPGHGVRKLLLGGGLQSQLKSGKHIYPSPPTFKTHVAAQDAIADPACSPSAKMPEPRRCPGNEHSVDQNPRREST